MHQGHNKPRKNTRGLCRQLKTAKITRVTNKRITIIFDDRHRAAPTAEQHSALAHNIGHVVRTYCLIQWKSWKVMPDEVKTKVCIVVDELQFRGHQQRYVGIRQQALL